MTRTISETLSDAEDDVTHIIDSLRKYHGYSGAIQSLADDMDQRQQRRLVQLGTSQEKSLPKK